MAHLHMINGGPMRRGATVYSAGTGTFVPFAAVPTQATPESPAADRAALGEGFRAARPVAAGDFASATNAPASVVLAAPGPGRSHAVHGVDFGYSAAPTGGLLTVTDGTTTYRVPVTSAGPGPLDFSPPMVFAPNAQVSGSLSAGGGGVVGYFGFSGRSVV